LDKVKPKKNLGQHFLTDKRIAEKIVDTLTFTAYKKVMEVGPGMGVLTDFLITKTIPENLYLVDIDTESITFLKNKYPSLPHIISGDFLTLNLPEIIEEPFAIIGNFPYNISSQIVFKILDNKEYIPEMCGMFQKEVAERICATPGSKIYGILSVLTQAFYRAEYLFTVKETVFNPPPKVKSGVIRLTRIENTLLPCNEILFKDVVKSAFNQRRKTLRNSLKMFITDEKLKATDILNKRPEQLSVADFINLIQLIEQHKK
jgi:16S rRNA (adenine1518-N6/adenine1519-N6)-dimethyltransferase